MASELLLVRRLAVVVLLLNVASAALFIGLVKNPVYDDVYHILDVHNYAANGLSRLAIATHRNAPGPTSYLWMAAGVRLLGGDELRDARIAVLTSWVLLGIGILAGARFSSFPQVWYSALLTVLVFPHAVMASATLLTEGPSLLFAMLGALAWTEFADQYKVTAGRFVLGMLGGLALGVAVTSRQYNLAILAAAGLFAVWRYPACPAGEKLRWSASVILSLILAAVPVLLLIAAWRGLSSPGMAAGTADPHWNARIGFSLFRPLASAFYTSVYFVPFGFPVMARLKSAARWCALLAASLGGIVAAIFRTSLLQPGPLRTFVLAASRVRAGGFVVFGFIVAVTIYCMISLIWWLWEERAGIPSQPLLIFALLTVMLFVAVQAGVGGNHPVYERYTLQIAPFLGIIAFSLFPRLTYSRIAVLVALSVVAHVMLWRYAFRA